MKATAHKITDTRRIADNLRHIRRATLDYGIALSGDLRAIEQELRNLAHDLDPNPERMLELCRELTVLANSVDPGIGRAGLYEQTCDAMDSLSDELNPVDRFHTVCDGSTRGPVIGFPDHGQPDPEVVR